jgi:hypothetical protein
MASGHKTGGRQKGTPKKRKAECDAKFAEAAGRATAGLSLVVLFNLRERWFVQRVQDIPEIVSGMSLCRER